MSLSRYVLVMSFATLVAWGAFLLVLFNVDPYDGGVIGRALFLTSLFFALFGTLSVAGFLARARWRKGIPLYWHVLNAFRQALLVSLVCVASLILQAGRLLTWWNILVLLLAATLLEIFFITRQPKRQHI
ncbi:MAG: hypothetical protein AB1352_05565 [Patescibacteria group bacterium]